MWLAVAYYTPSTVYEECAKRLQASASKFAVPLEISLVPDQGNWYKNTQYKPVFLLEQLKKYKPNSLAYVDIDATFEAHPHLFYDLDKSDTEIAVHVLDHKKFYRTSGKELLSGTIFLKNTENVHSIIEKWIKECKKDQKILDQTAFSSVLRYNKYVELPEEYCCIFDTMASVKNPVIKHWQASRTTKHQGNGINKTRINLW
jgi:hypothetical protein